MPTVKTNLVRTSNLIRRSLFILSGGNDHFPAIDWPINPLTSSFGYGLKGCCHLHVPAPKSSAIPC